MKIEIHCKGMPLTDAIREHVEEKLGKMSRMLPAGVEPLMMLHYESESHGGSYSAEVTFRVWGQDMVSKASTDDLYKAVSEVAEQVTRQVRRLKDKRDSKRKGGQSLRDYQEPAPAADEDLDEYD